MMGDSVVRLVYAALLGLLSTTGEEVIKFRHQDFEYTMDCNVRISFLWAPHPGNITTRLTQWRHEGQPLPDVLILSSALWPILHVGDDAQFGQELVRIRELLMQRHSMPDGTTRSMNAAMTTFWMSASAVVPAKLKTEQKRQMMTPERVRTYNWRMGAAGILRPRGPAHLLEMYRITAECGPGCTEDGIHYNNATYGVTLQKALNAVRFLRRSSVGRGGSTARFECLMRSSDSTEPSDLAGPMHPTDTAEPPKATERSGVTEQTELAEPSDRAGPMHPTDTAEPTEPTEPTGLAEQRASS